MSQQRGLLIGGRWESGRTREAVTDPATGNTIGHTAVADPDDVRRAVEAARGAQPAWAALAPGERRDVLSRAGDLIEGRVDEISRVLTLEQGKPIADSRKEVLFSAEVLRYYGEEGMRLHADLRRSARLPDVRSLVEWRPYGVVGAIVPWNYPVDLWSWKVGGALAAGNAVVAKPPIETPLAVGLAAECLVEAGLPEGVLSDLPGRADVGSALVTIDGVDMVSVTASVETGKAVAAAAVARLTPLLLELGGHSPFVVLDDADVEQAAAAATRRSFSNTGQICIAVNRAIVADRIADDFAEAVAAATDQIVVGDPSDPATTMGPATVDDVVERTSIHLEDAMARGGRLVRGGDAEGRYLRPIVVDRVPLDAKAMNEETYGPLLPIHRVASDDEALAVANGLEVGLAAYVFGEDLERVWRFAERLEFGMVGVNINDTTELGAPFGGWKLSGFGAELGPEGLRNYARLRHIRMKLW
ncbi:MAG TPA: aldehyde dehydrogenase family protein [Acidimicrobiia bacterium]|nr:aldehyde dehydrogenase family protein [Acidimicrobiia bacterium]